MQKSNNVEFIKMQSDGARSPQGHCNKAIGYTLVLRTAIIRPKSGYACFNKRSDVIVGGNGELYEPILVELKIGEGIHNGVVRQNILYHRFCGTVIFDV